MRTLHNQELEEINGGGIFTKLTSVVFNALGIWGAYRSVEEYRNTWDTIDIISDSKKNKAQLDFDYMMLKEDIGSSAQDSNHYSE